MFTDRIIRSYGAPNSVHDMWLDLNDNVLKHFINGKWTPILGSGGDSDGDSSGDSGGDSGGSSDLAEKISILESILGISLEPELDEKYYEYFTMEAEGNVVIKFRQSSYASDAGMSPLKVEVSADNGETWTEYTASPDDGTEIADMSAGDKILIRGKNEAYGYYDANNNEGVENCNFIAETQEEGDGVFVYGNIMSLVGGDDFARLRKVKDYAFAHFFSDYNGDYDWSWVKSKEDKELLLPATTLAQNCYSHMFVNCVSLITAPELPATTLAQNCYSHMFGNCVSLTTAPELPATTLAEDCYNYMFDSCMNLTTAPELPATTLVHGCYESMFYGCINLTTAPELPAMTLAKGCYDYMFDSCINLTTAPELPATTLVHGCYEGMFLNCTSLAYIKAMFITAPGTSYTSDWVQNVKSTGTFVKNANATWTTTGVNGIPFGWTVETA